MATFAGNFSGAIPAPVYNSPFPGRKFHLGTITVPPGTGTGGAPDLTIVTPSLATDPLLITITDSGSVLRITECNIRIGTGSRIVAYDEVEGFLPPYNGRSTIVGTGTILDPLVITLYRFGNWPTGIPIDAKIKAVDSAGNKVIE